MSRVLVEQDKEQTGVDWQSGKTVLWMASKKLTPNVNLK